MSRLLFLIPSKMLSESSKISSPPLHFFPNNEIIVPKLR